MIQSAFYLWILLQCSAGLEIFLQNNHGHLIDSQHLNGTYSIPLLTSRKVLVRINAKLLQNSVDNNKRSLVAFRLQAKTKEQNVVELENEISLKTSNDGDGHVLLEDLFIRKLEEPCFFHRVYFFFFVSFSEKSEKTRTNFQCLSIAELKISGR